MMKLSDHKIFLRGIGMAVLIFIAMFYFSNREMNYANYTASWISHTQEVLLHNERLLLSASNIETGGRTFLLTGQEQFREILFKADSTSVAEINAIKTLTVDNTIQQLTIDSLGTIIKKRMVFSDSIVRLKKQANNGMAAGMVAESDGKFYLDRISKLGKSIQDEENRLLIIRKNNNQAAINIQHNLFIYSIFAMLAILIYIFWQERKYAIKKEKNISETMFKNLLDATAEAMIIVNAANIIVFLNKQAEALFKYSKTELDGADVKKIINGDFKVMRQQVAELVAVTKSGNQFPVEVSLYPLQTKDGMLVCASVRDITEKKKSAERIQFLASIADNIKDPVITSDNNFLITRWNHAAQQLLEWKNEEVIGKTTTEVLDVIFPNQDEEKIRASFKQKDFWQGELIYHTRSRRVVNVMVTASRLRDANNTITGNLILVRDITARITAEKQLKEFEHFFNNSNDLSCIANDRGYFEILNPSFTRILGYNEDELSKNPFLDFVHPDDIASTLNEYNKLKSGATIIHFFNRYRKKDGDYLWFDWNASLNPLTGKLYCIARDITDRRKAEDDLSQLNQELEQRVQHRTRDLDKSEKRFRKLLENNYDIISLMDESFKILYRSPSAARVTGWADQDMTQQDPTINIHPDDLPMAKETIRELMKHPGKPIKTSFRNRHKDGYYLWIEGTLINLLKDEDIKAIVFNFRDVTQRKELENLLNKANSLARIGGWEVDLIKGTVYWTDITKEIHETSYDYTPDLETGIRFYKEGESRDLITEKVRAAAAYGTPWDVELQIVTAKNNDKWVRCIGETQSANEKCVKIIGSFQDIDQRKKAELKLVKSEELYRSLFTNMLNGFSYCQAIFDGDRLVNYKYLVVNKEYEKLTGLKDVTGRNMSEVIPGLLEADPAYAEMVKSVALDGQTHKFETYVKPLDNWFSVSLYSPEKGFFVSLVDKITDRKTAEQKIQKINTELEERVTVRTRQLKKSSEEMEAFSYSVSHDLRGPLRGIIGFAAILEEEYGNKLGHEALRITSTIKRNAARMGQLIDDLLAFSRMGRQDISKTSFSSEVLVREIIHEMNPVLEKGQMDWHIHDLTESYADRNMIKQVWANLISNAVKYSGKANRPSIEIGSFNSNQQSTFFVKDNGAGFDEKYKHKLFKVFQRLHSNEEFEGTGVGLAIVEKIITKHGGSVWAEATINMGASFYFTLPLMPVIEHRTVTN